MNPWPRRAAIIVGIGVVVLLGYLLLLWRDADKWVSFGKVFAVSPAMAGLAAVTAAVIGSRALKRQLDQTVRQFGHTESEARHARDKDAEASWWEKFEWVTDRILPKDAKQTSLEKPLALSLLRSLLEMATADFQRAAVNGVIEHYLSPDNAEDARPEQSPRNIDSEVQALRALDEATRGTAGTSRATEAALRGALYDQQASLALAQMGLPMKVEPRFLIREDSGRGVRIHLDAILTVGDRRVGLEFKGWDKFSPWSAANVDSQAALVTKEGQIDDLVLVTRAEIPPEFPRRFVNMRLVHWMPEEGSAALEGKIRTALASEAAYSDEKPY